MRGPRPGYDDRGIVLQTRSAQTPSGMDGCRDAYGGECRLLKGQQFGTCHDRFDIKLEDELGIEVFYNLPPTSCMHTLR